MDFGIELTVNGVSTGAKPRAAAVAAGRWPPRGVVEFRQVWMQYRDNPPVLKGISFTSKPGERIGVSVTNLLRVFERRILVEEWQ